MSHPPPWTQHGKETGLYAVANCAVEPQGCLLSHINHGAPLTTPEESPEPLASWNQPHLDASVPKRALHGKHTDKCINAETDVGGPTPSMYGKNHAWPPFCALRSSGEIHAGGFKRCRVHRRKYANGSKDQADVLRLTVPLATCTKYDVVLRRSSFPDA